MKLREEDKQDLHGGGGQAVNRLKQGIASVFCFGQGGVGVCGRQRIFAKGKKKNKEYMLLRRILASTYKNYQGDKYLMKSL